MTTALKINKIASALALTLLPGIASASIFGFLGNFDVINDTGSTAHGFEIELEGLLPSDITDTFGGANRGFPSGRGFDSNIAVVRYGAPVVEPNATNTGTIVRYSGLWDPNSSTWDFGTPSGTFITPGDNCWTGGGVGYSAATPCDHFGVGTSKNPTNTKYSWLLETTTPGTLTNGSVTLPAPTWNPNPAPVDPAVQAAQPYVPAIQAPAPENEAQFGEAIWVKVFRTEAEDPIRLEDLVGGNRIFNNAVTEVEWQLLQYDPDNPDKSGKLEQGYMANLGANADAVAYRYEFYKFGGTYNPETNEALLEGNDSNPSGNDVGTYLGAQNGGFNLNAVVPAVPVPPAFVLMGTGLLGFVANRRVQLRKKSA